MNTKNLLFTAILIILSLIGGSTAEAQIIYTDVIPDTTVQSDGGVYALDLNNDGITDFNIAIFNNQIAQCGSSGSNKPGGCGTITNYYIIITPNGVNAIISDSDSEWSMTSAFLLGTPIDSSSSTWNNNSNFLEALGYYCFQGESCEISLIGNFGSEGDKYIALQLDVNSQKYYGWVRLSTYWGQDGFGSEGGGVGDPSSFTVKDYAYNSTPDQPILAGQLNNNPIVILPSTNYCVGDSIAIPITSNYILFNTSNYFIAQLSDSVGSFSNPLILDSIQSTNSITINTIIPTGLYPSTNYKIRIISTDTSLISIPSMDFTINRPPSVVTVSNMYLNGNDTICPLDFWGSPEWSILGSNFLYPCIDCSYQWQFNGLDMAGEIGDLTGGPIGLTTSGIYHVAVTNACGVSSSNNYTLFVMPVINITMPDTMVCLNSLPMQLNALPASGTYSFWNSICCGESITGGGIFNTPSMLNGATVNAYYIYYSLYDSFGCHFSHTMMLNVNLCADVSEISNFNTLDIYPIPTTGIMNLSEPVNITLSGLSGKVLLEEKNTNQLDISTLPAGMYFLHFGENNNQIVKVIKE